MFFFLNLFEKHNYVLICCKLYQFSIVVSSWDGPIVQFYISLWVSKPTALFRCSYSNLVYNTRPQPVMC